MPVLVPVAALLVLAACGSEPPPLLLGGPTANIVVAIPEGWHQVVNSANPVIAEMVAPTDCLGRNEVACATGLARVATFSAPSQAAAVQLVSRALTTEPGVTPGATVSEGPGTVGGLDGYRRRFTFRNPRAGLTAEVAAVASGSPVPDPRGNREFSVVLAWVSDQPGAPPADVIDRIVDSAQVRGGPLPR
jgi:hypothetical protein